MPSTVRIEIDSSVRNVAPVQRAIGELLSEHGVGAARREQLEPKVSDILQITQLITTFELYGSGEEAVASFD